MKKIIITLAIIIGFVTAAYADGAWDRVVQDSEACAMVAYEIPTTPISREIPKNRTAKNRIKNYAKSDEKSLIAMNAITSASARAAIKHSGHHGIVSGHGLIPNSSSNSNPAFDATISTKTIGHRDAALGNPGGPIGIGFSSGGQAELDRNSSVPVVAQGSLP